MTGLMGFSDAVGAVVNDLLEPRAGGRGFGKLTANSIYAQNKARLRGLCFFSLSSRPKSL